MGHVNPGQITLDQLPMNFTATVIGLDNRGLERRRMMDLGILPGTRIAVEMKNPLGDPTAYRIRGAVIALRREQAQTIRIIVEEV
jgi:ferrous iron transport protein A